MRLSRRRSSRFTAFAAFAVLMGVWEAATYIFAVPAFVLPSPSRILSTMLRQRDVLAGEALVTLGEIAGGFVIGTACGMAAALVMARWRRAEEALGPLLVVAQALPVFAIAPVLVLWLGFGYASKVAMAALIIFFPVATSFMEGLRRTDEGLVDLARLHRASAFDTMWLIRIPAALPSLAAGLRVAAAVAPLGAIVGEWVGASAGLGLLMLHANARMQTDMVFAALFVLVMISLALWAFIGILTRYMLRWSPDTL